MATQNMDDRAAEVLQNPDQWKTGDEPITTAQESYLQTLAREAGEPVQADLTKAEASKKIEELQEETGRGRSPTPKRRRRTKGNAASC